MTNEYNMEEYNMEVPSFDIEVPLVSRYFIKGPRAFGKMCLMLFEIEGVVQRVEDFQNFRRQPWLKQRPA